LVDAATGKTWMVAAEREGVSSLAYLRLVEVTGNFFPQVDIAEQGSLVFVTGNCFLLDVDHQVVPLEDFCILFV